MSHGEGSHVWDVDGNEYVDMHGGYGAAIAGHGHPALVEAVSARVRRGTHFAQPTEDAIWVAEELAPSLRPAAVAVRQLRHRGDHGRRAPDARVTGPRPRAQGRGLLPRPPRLGAGLGAARGRRGRPGRAPAPGARQHRDPPGDHGPDRGRAVQRPRRRRAGARRAPRPGRRDDPRAGDDERRHHPARRRLPRRPRATCCTPRTPTSPSTRSRPASPPVPPAPPAATASRPTSSAWPRRWAAASRSPRSAAPTR